MTMLSAQNARNLASETNDSNELQKLYSTFKDNFAVVNAIVQNHICPEEIKKDFLLYTLQHRLPRYNIPGKTDMLTAMTKCLESWEPEKSIKEAKRDIEIDWSVSIKKLKDELDLVGVEDILEKMVSAVHSGKHIILYGSPGTGKTHLSEYFCNKIDVNFGLYTATSEWTTFETIGGYRPDFGNSEKLNFSNGIVLDSFQNKRWLIIDEINRADIDKAFGELFTLLSGKNVKLPFSKLSDGSYKEISLIHESNRIEDDEMYLIQVPLNWRLIGTMNTFDKSSLLELSYAFMRRFAFIEVPLPNKDDYKNILISGFKDHHIDEFYKNCLDILEKLFIPEKDKGMDKLGLLVGPAIPLDIIKYIISRRTLYGTEEELSEKELVLEGIEMYLYPQFEGRDIEHNDIINIIRSILNLGDISYEETTKKLKVWTGYVQ